MILSLQGCMAVGKTTAVRYLQEHAPYIHVSAEDTRAVIEEVRRRKLDKNCYPDYLEIQKLWLKNEVTRYQKAVRYPCSVMDFGAEEIEFYTLNYPKSIGADWEVENALKPELEDVRACLPDRILFLDASEEVLRPPRHNRGSPWPRTVAMPHKDPNYVSADRPVNRRTAAQGQARQRPEAEGPPHPRAEPGASAGQRLL